MLKSQYFNLFLHYSSEFNTVQREKAFDYEAVENWSTM